MDEPTSVEYVECWGDIRLNDPGYRWCGECKPSTRDAYVAAAYGRFDAALVEARGTLRRALAHLAEPG